MENNKDREQELLDFITRIKAEVDKVIVYLMNNKIPVNEYDEVTEWKFSNFSGCWFYLFERVCKINDVLVYRYKGERNTTLHIKATKLKKDAIWLQFEALSDIVKKCDDYIGNYIVELLDKKYDIK